MPLPGEGEPGKRLEHEQRRRGRGEEAHRRLEHGVGLRPDLHHPIQQVAGLAGRLPVEHGAGVAAKDQPRQGERGPEPEHARPARLWQEARGRDHRQDGERRRHEDDVRAEQPVQQAVRADDEEHRTGDAGACHEGPLAGGAWPRREHQARERQADETGRRRGGERHTREQQPPQPAAVHLSRSA